MSSHRLSVSARLLGAVAAGTLSVAGLGAAGASIAVAAPVVVETTPPEPTTPSEPTSPPVTVTTPPNTVPSDNGSDSTDWLPIVLVAVGVIALITILALAFSRRSPAPNRRANTASAESNLLSTSQWVNDQLTLELLAADPAAAKQRWATERSRLDNVAIGAQQQWSAGHGDGWQTLGQTMSALASAIDTNINVRNQSPPDPALVTESTNVVNRHRTALQQLIAALWPTVDR